MNYTAWTDGISVTSIGYPFDLDNGQKLQATTATTYQSHDGVLCTRRGELYQGASGGAWIYNLDHLTDTNKNQIVLVNSYVIPYTGSCGPRINMATLQSFLNTLQCPVNTKYEDGNCLVTWGIHPTSQWFIKDETLYTKIADKTGHCNLNMVDEGLFPDGRHCKTKVSAKYGLQPFIQCNERYTAYSLYVKPIYI